MHVQLDKITHATCNNTNGGPHMVIEARRRKVNFNMQVLRGNPKLKEVHARATGSRNFKASFSAQAALIAAVAAEAALAAEMLAAEVAAVGTLAAMAAVYRR
jgi:hypothetical protein